MDWTEIIELATNLTHWFTWFFTIAIYVKLTKNDKTKTKSDKLKDIIKSIH